MADKLSIGAELKLETAKSLENVGKFKQALREAQKAVTSVQEEFGELSAEALQAAKYTAQLKDKIQEAREVTELFDPGKKFQVATNAITALAGGFSAVQGAMGLFGSESEQVEKTLLKVQSAMALSQGLSTIADSAKDFQRLGAVIQSTTVFQKANNVATVAAAAVQKLFAGAVVQTSTSFKVLKGAIVATGIGALVVLLGFLISKVSDWMSGTDAAEAAQRRLNDALEQQQDLLDRDIKGLDQSLKQQILRAKIAGKTEEELSKIESKFGQEKIDRLKANYESLDKIASDFEGRKNEDQQKAIKASTDAYRAYLDEIGNQDTADLQRQADHAQKVRDQKKQDDDKNDAKSKQEVEKQKQKAKELLDQQKQNAEAARDLNEELRKENSLVNKSAEEQELIKLKQQFDEKQAVLQKAGASEMELQNWFESQKAQIQQKYRDEERDKAEEERLKKEEADKAEAERRLQLRTESINGVIEASQRLAEDETMSVDARRSVLEESERNILANTAYTEEERTRLLKANADARKTIDELEAQHKAETVNQIGNFLGAASDLAGKNTAVGKGLAVAETTISTYAAAQKAYQSQLIPGDPSSIFRAAIAAGASIISGLVRVRSILSVQVPKGGGVSSPSVNTSAPSVPQIPLNSTTSLDQNSINAIGNQVNKVFVTETDIANNQERTERLNRAARLE